MYVRNCRIALISVKIRCGQNRQRVSHPHFLPHPLKVIVDTRKCTHTQMHTLKCPSHNIPKLILKTVAVSKQTNPNLQQ